MEKESNSLDEIILFLIIIFLKKKRGRDRLNKIQYGIFHRIGMVCSSRIKLVSGSFKNDTYDQDKDVINALFTSSQI